MVFRRLLRVACGLDRGVAGEEPAADGEFAGGEGQGFLGDGFGAAGDFKDHVAWPDDGDPVFGGAFSLTHTGFEGFLGDRLVGEDADPDLAAAVHATGGGDTCGLDLRASEPGAVEDLETEVTEVEFVIARRDSGAGAPLNLSVLCAFWH